MISQNIEENTIKELKTTIVSYELEDIINIIYSKREPRDLVGSEGILIRTLGDNFQGLENYIRKYYDERREKEVDTEFFEVIEALNIYDLNPNNENTIELLLEVGDILFQKKIIETKHTHNEYLDVANKQFNLALNYIQKELKSRDLSINIAEDLVKTKYGIRAWLSENGYDPKNKELEKKLCLEVYLTS